MTLLIIYLVIAIGVSFLCSILEAVLLSIPPSYIAEMKKAGRGAMLSKMKGNLDQSISSILILNTFAHTMGAAGVGAQAIKVFGDKWETLIAFLLTLAILYLSEIIPKTLGATFWRQLAIPSAYIIAVLVKLVFPLVWLSTRITRLFSSKGSYSTSREEVLAVASLSYKDGAIVSQENQLVENILTLREAKTSDILTPRSVVHALNEDTKVVDALKTEQTAVFTRIPIYKDSIDNITGVIIKGQLYENDRQGNGDLQLKAISKPIHRISENFPVLNLLDLFIKRGEHIFLVEDHFGQTAGIVTLEDAIETILGREIVDESDRVADMQKLARSKYRERLRNKLEK
ncbi:CNNM domain-containing protein [Thalassotalea ponticola]|uniref:CNNM domain-containing protein n=1 Tax=Thalassotalea ponticola TaxID=1523392 RepID=UPI0025B4A26D|nr:CNNM domain-containing protein [Thalassotalea ponticola]MDN3652188.1 CNNM domain-containing protein [Thalassotalea ponticola]